MQMVVHCFHILRSEPTKSMKRNTDCVYSSDLWIKNARCVSKMFNHGLPFPFCFIYAVIGVPLLHMKGFFVLQSVFVSLNWCNPIHPCFKTRHDQELAMITFGSSIPQEFPWLLPLVCLHSHGKLSIHRWHMMIYVHWRFSIAMLK